MSLNSFMPSQVEGKMDTPFSENITGDGTINGALTPSDPSSVGITATDSQRANAMNDAQNIARQKVAQDKAQQKQDAIKRFENGYD